MPTEKEIARWSADRRAAEARERDEQRDRPLDPGASFARAMGLIALAAQRHGCPLPVDRQEENLAYHLTWARPRKSVAEGLATALGKRPEDRGPRR